MMCEAHEAIRSRTREAHRLTRACEEQCGVIASAFASVLAEPIPNDMKRLVRIAERRLRR